MPRWDKIHITNVYYNTADNVVSVFNNYKHLFNFKNQDSTSLPNDIQLKYDADIDFDTVDLKLVYNLEALIQRLYFFLITEKGTLPGDQNFGTRLGTLIGLTEQIDLSTVIKMLYEDLLHFDDIEHIYDIKGEILLQDYARIINLQLEFKPKNFMYRMFLDLEIFP